MVEEILVFRGVKVTYAEYYSAIKCESREDCFTIEGIKPDQILSEGAIAFNLPTLGFSILGNELWSNGKYYIIKTNSLFDKNQIKPPIIRGRER